MDDRRDWHEDTPASDVGVSTPVLDRTYKPALTAGLIVKLVEVQDYMGYLLRSLSTGHLDAALQEADQLVSHAVYLQQAVKQQVDEDTERNVDIFRGAS